MDVIWLRIQNYGVVALAGTTFPIDRQLSSDLLEFKQPYT
ncbi:argininosuccinate lyase, partial [Streptococcus pneumoniae]|nr:argininosuccinate lyase [Streptococcus pneumoniae]